MSQLFNILKITVGEDKLRARVLVNPGMPVRTSEDIEATARVYYLAPAIAKHLCLGDTGREFQDCMADTELAHLLEHLSVEIMRQTGLAGDVSAGRTRGVAEDKRLFDIELSCPDDVLTVGALSSATFMMDWAFLHADAQAPDFAGTVKALAQLVESLRDEGPGQPEDEGDAAAPDAATPAPAAADAFAAHASAYVPEASPSLFTANAPQGSAAIDTEGGRDYGIAPATSTRAVFGGAAAEVQSRMPFDASDPGATVSMRPLA